MAVTMTVTPEPANVPPRVKIELETNDPARTFSEITIRRDGQVIRAAAPTGSTVSVVYDYDCPFGRPVTYEAGGVDGGLSTVLDVTWANLSGWATAGGSPAVAGGKLTTGTVERAMPAFDVLVLHDADELNGGGIAEYLTGFPAAGRSITGDGTGILYYDPLSFGAVNTLPGSGDWTLTRTQIYSDAGTWSNPYNLPNGGDKLRVVGPCPGFTLYEGTAPADFSLSDGVQLDATEAWLIHPINPDLSVRVSGNSGGLYVTSESGAQITYDEQRELFTPLGRSRRVPVTYGPRRAGEWSLELCAPTIADRDPVLDLLADQSPVLFRKPASSPWDLPDDWYSVGSVEDRRDLDKPTHNRRTLTLPLTPVDVPVLAQGAQWTYADDLILNPTYADSLTEFSTYLSRLVGPS